MQWTVRVAQTVYVVLQIPRLIMQDRTYLDLQILTNQQSFTVMFWLPYTIMLFTMLNARDLFDQSTALDRFLAEIMPQCATSGLIGWHAGSHRICIYTYIVCFRAPGSIEQMILRLLSMKKDHVLSDMSVENRVFKLRGV